MDIQTGSADTRPRKLPEPALAPGERWYAIWHKEAWFQLTKSLPMAVAGTIRSLTTILEVQALGHAGTNPLAGRSIALLVVNLTGYPFMYGLGGALESLCSQAFTGARGSRRIGVYVQHSIWLFLAANILIALLWTHPNIIFRLLATKDSEVLQYARTFLLFECLYFPCIVVQSNLKRFLLAQGLMRPTVYFEAVGLATMFVSLQILVWNPSTSLGFIGVPISSTIAYAAVLVANIVYIQHSACKSEWGRFTFTGFKQNARQLTSLGVPCGISGIASYGFADMATIAVTFLSPDDLAIQAVLNSSKSAFTRTGSYLGMVVSNRVGNLLGARKPTKSLLAAKVSIAMTSAATLVVAILMLSFQHTLAMFITKDSSLISGLIPLVPLLVIVVVFDTLSSVLTGVLRGQGRQAIAAVIRVISLYFVGVPLAYTLCFPLEYGLYGLWVGLSVGFVVICAAEGWLVLISDWHAEVKRSIERVNEEGAGVDSPLGESSPLVHPNRLC
ncbi:ethionine resistance protein [Coemansia sp. RSA 1935]|nr:ethionine resistance protein [Coemansia sp. RSA 637]KAJ2529630.1 ethionine resistance protein [Coemansia sp. RSA 1935]KAJ2548695.1 ethionine resistance protein [Coemansia sp. RSA 1878]